MRIAPRLGVGLGLLPVLEETKGSADGITFKKPKTANGRRNVTPPIVVVDTLKEHRRRQLELRLALGLGRLADDTLVFPRLTGEPQSPVGFSAAWGDTAAAIGIPEISFHALRHTHVSQLIDAGVDVATISPRLGGSATPRPTSRYRSMLTYSGTAIRSQPTPSTPRWRAWLRREIGPGCQ